MLADLSAYEKYFVDDETDEKIVVKKDCPANVKAKLKKLDDQHKKTYGETLFRFE